MTKYVDFIECSIEGQKSKRFEVVNKSAPAVVLGRIQFYPPWRRYVFMPAYPTVFDVSCLHDITIKLELLTEERKTQTRV